MKYKFHNLKNKLKILLIVNLFIINSQSISSNKHFQHKILINSNVQSIDIQTNKLICTGQVNINYGTLRINADLITINHTKGKIGHEIIEGHGKPITFRQLQKNNQPIYGQASKIRYEVNNHTIFLIGNAHIKILNNNITGDQINYIINKNYIEASSNSEKQVTTILLIYT